MMLRYSLLTAGLLLGSSALAAPAGDLPLMPWPANVERPSTQGALILNDTLSVSVSGDDLGDAVDRLRQRIALQTGWTLQPQAVNPDKPTIHIAIAKKVTPQPLPDSDESYTASISRPTPALVRCGRWKRCSS
jgi:hexosaminidase